MATILVVEDERELNTLIRRHLKDDGHRVAQAHQPLQHVQQAYVSVNLNHDGTSYLDAGKWYSPSRQRKTLNTSCDTWTCSASCRSLAVM